MRYTVYTSTKEVAIIACMHCCLRLTELPFIGSEARYYAPSELHQMLRKCNLITVEKLELEFYIITPSGMTQVLTPPSYNTIPQSYLYYIDYSMYDYLRETAR